MRTTFQIAQGTVAGTEHTRVGKNNQDALCVRADDERLVVVVCDGCSSGTTGSSHNEIGAQIGAQIVATELWYAVSEEPELNWRLVRRNTVEALRKIVSSAGGLPGGDAGTGLSRSALVSDMFLFTIVAACITPRYATFAAIGDGTLYVNGERIKLGPFPNNAPPYIGYALVESAIDPKLLEFDELMSMSTERLQSFLIGTDGAADLAAAWERVLPTGRPVGVIERLWEEDRFFNNPDMLRRHLTLVNGGVDRRHPGHLKDDTTIVVGRRSRG